VARLSTWVCLIALFSGIVGARLSAQLSEEEKRKRALFLKAREEMRTVASPTPSKSPSPKAKPKAATRPKKKKPKEKAKPEETPKPKPKPTAKPKATETPEPEETPTPKAKATATVKPTPKATAPPERESPRPVTVPTPAPRIAPATAAPIDEEPQVVIRKSGLEKSSGFSLPFRIFGKRYRYLSRSVRGQIDRAPVLRRRWQFIVVHNSGTRQGNARIFNYYHRNVRRMRNGLAYHFVIGNGTSSGNGEIEVGARWRRQINGGHVHSDYLNNIALGICLVGDFNRDQPTRAQLDSCEELIRYLRLRCGKIDARFASVRPHREMNPPRWATDCPGDDFPYGWFRRFRE
jgi:hypothetical protein